MNAKFALMALTLTFTVANAQNTENGHVYVDLGLPSGLKWATCNVGANTPEEMGGFYAWGETETKELYDWSTYKFGTENNFSRYNSVDGKTVLELEDDAANANWGGSWRMPTIAEFQEIIDNCTWTYNTENGGYTVTGTNGNSIFLPQTGYYYGSSFQGDMAGFYRTSSMSEYSISLSIYVSHWNPDFGMGTTYIDGIQRGHGMSVRPVCIPTKWYDVKIETVEGGSVKADSTKFRENDEVTLAITPNAGYDFESVLVKNGENEIGVTDNKFTMPAGDVTISAVFALKDYEIVVDAVENGTISVKSTSAKMNEEVTIEVFPAAGYELQSLSVKSGENEIAVVDNRFKMPIGGVEISARFKQQTTTAIENAELSDIFAENGRVYCDDEFKIYDMLGRDVTRMNGSLHGIYVVRTANQSKKMVVR